MEIEWARQLSRWLSLISGHAGAAVKEAVNKKELFATQRQPVTGRNSYWKQSQLKIERTSKFPWLMHNAKIASTDIAIRIVRILILFIVTKFIVTKLLVEFEKTLW